MHLFQKAPPGWATRWSSFENPSAGKGVAAGTNRGAKGAAFGWVEPRATTTLLDVEGSGIVNRFWLTVDNRTPEMLRSLRLDFYWDGSATPAVSCPLGDFFCVSHGRTVAFENEFFASPEGRSFVCNIPMPFRRGAKLTLTNESPLLLEHLFYDVNLLQGVEHNDDVLYFHAHWRREAPNTLGQPFEVLPQVHGSGRFLGASVGVQTNPAYGSTWWGEGEFKAWLDGDTELPTLCGSGTEDYIGTGWGQGTFATRWHGSPLADAEAGRYSFYRLHGPDPVYFHKSFRAALDTIGGAPKSEVRKLQAAGAALIPVTVDAGAGQFVRLLDENRSLDDAAIGDDRWCNFYRCDDWNASAYFYLDQPENGLPALAPVAERLEGLA